MQGCSSIGRALVSKTSGWEFESPRPCHLIAMEGDSGGGGAGEARPLPNVRLSRECRSTGRLSGRVDHVGKQSPVNAIIQELFRVGLYKRSQGRITRQVTCGALAVVILLGCMRLMQFLMDYDSAIRYGVPGVLFLIGFWIAYRLVNYPAFTDFLIAVEAEMNKVSWPSRSELIRSSIVVLLLIFVLAALLLGYDFVWRVFFTKWVPIL